MLVSFSTTIFFRRHLCYIIIQNKGNEDIKIPDIQRDDEGKESV